MLVYHYDPDTSEYCGSADARLDPLETGLRGSPVYLLPGHATFESPPAPGTRQTARWQDGSWSLVPDWRDVPLWSRTTREPVRLALGETPDWDVVADAEPPAPLEAVKAAARQRLAVAAEAQRQLHITPGPGKALIYTQKYDEAGRIKALLASGGTPAGADFPLAAGRAALLGVTLEAVADEWIARRNGWYAVGAAIEAVYEAGMVAVDAAADQAGVAAALAAVAWPTPG